MTFGTLGRAQRARTLAVTLFSALAISGGLARAAVVISTGATQGVNCSAGVCTPTAAKANLNVTELANMLASADAKVVSDSAALDIKFSAPLSWTSASRLTLDSHRSIVFQQPVSVTGTGALTIATDDGGKGGDFSFEKKGRIQFWDLHSSLIINGRSYALVNSISQLAQAIGQHPSHSYALANDYNAGKDGVYSQSPIVTTFTGSFEGLGNTIRGLQISTDASIESLGLFAFVSSGGLLRDLNIIDANVRSSEAMFVGLLAGHSFGSTIQNVYGSGSVDGGCCLAGEYGVLIGWSDADSIRHVASSGSVSGSNGVGGLIGETNGTILTWSHSTANVSSSFAYAGGLVGEAAANDGKSHIDHSFATGSVTAGSSTPAGGLVGSSVAAVDNSYATGAVTGGDQARLGGLIGDSLDVANSYATGTVTGGANATVGGLLGNGGHGAKSSYSTGAISSGSGSSIGGLIGHDYTVTSAYKSAYWDLDTSGVSDPAQGAGNVGDDPGITGLTDAQLKSALPRGFDPKLWGQSPSLNNGYPYLKANPPPQ